VYVNAEQTPGKPYLMPAHAVCHVREVIHAVGTVTIISDFYGTAVIEQGKVRLCVCVFALRPHMAQVVFSTACLGPQNYRWRRLLIRDANKFGIHSLCTVFKRNDRVRLLVPPVG
jgi:hypothetical protein